jgi:BirA family biotin operon repressor/biotin-[acetyl-CoA-carboxylase] ligase
MYDLAALEAELVETIFAGKLHFAAVTGSTNNDAMAAARKGAAHGSVYFADAQSAGRGRSDHRWESAHGEGIYVSVVLRPQASVDRWSLLPLCTGLAAMEAMRTVAGVAPDLRWPNDVLVADHKLCGILVEAGTDERGEKFAVAGIGINVHQRAFPADLQQSVTSLDGAAGRTIPRQSVLVCLLQSLQRESEGLADEARVHAIPARMERSSTWLRGRRVRVHGPQACQGITAGLDAYGFLRVATATGIVTVQTGGIRAAEME